MYYDTIEINRAIMDEKLFLLYGDLSIRIARERKSLEIHFTDVKSQVCINVYIFSVHVLKDIAK